MRVVRIYEHGEPEVMRFEDLSLGPPGAGELLVKIEACGVNYIDIYFRSGLYPVKLPYAMGQEGSGTVLDVGKEAAEFKPGDWVAWTGVPGSYATHALIPARAAVKLPAGLGFQEGAAAMLQGMTAHYLSHSAYPLKKGETCLVHAAAGGVGRLLCQMGRRRGARVIGTVSTEEKAREAREAGANEVILYTKSDFEAEARRLTDGEGVHVVYDSVGKSTFEKSLGSLRLRGCLVLFGQSSGPVSPFDPQILNTKGSLFLTRPTLAHYTATRKELLWRAGDVLGWIAGGQLKLRIERTFPLEAAADAHRLLSSRQTSGKILLLP